jgi:flagellar export protein FliJ
VKRFSFRLESIRDLREQIEEQAQLGLAEALAAEAEAAERVISAQERLAGARANLGSGATGDELAGAVFFAERCERELAAATRAHALECEGVAFARRALHEASTRRQVLERLKERDRTTHATDAMKAEEHHLGEVALAMFRRKVA